jgi:hypothetical protein
MPSIADSKKKKRGPGRPKTGIGPAIGLRLYPELTARVEKHIREREPDKPSLPEALRRLVDFALKVKERRESQSGRDHEHPKAEDRS